MSFRRRVGVVRSLPVGREVCQQGALGTGQRACAGCRRAGRLPFLSRLASGSRSAGALSASSRIHGRLTCFSLTLTSCSSWSRPFGFEECGRSDDTSRRVTEEWLKDRLEVSLVRHFEARHVEALCDASVVRRVEVEVGVAMGLEASLPSWHGSRRNAEVMSGSKTAVSQSLGQGGALHRGRPAYNRVKGSVGFLNVASLPSFRRARPGELLLR